MADKNYYSIADQDGVVIENKTFPEPGIDTNEYSDIFKLSHASNITVKNCTIYGGREDCVDMNRECKDVVFENITVHSGGKYCFTVKGGTKNVTLKNVVIDGHGSEVDIDLGNWSDQSSELTTNIILDNVTSKSGIPVKVRVLWAEKPLVVGGSNVRLIVIPRPLYAIYRFLRKYKLVP